MFDIDADNALPDFRLDIGTFTAMMTSLGDRVSTRWIQELFDEVTT